MLPLTWLLVGCSGKGSDDASETASSETDDQTDTDSPTGRPHTGTPITTDTPHTDATIETGTLDLYGTVPSVALAPPVFSGVRNRDGASRNQADLIGHPTVMWFYPAAATGG